MVDVGRTVRVKQFFTGLGCAILPISICAVVAWLVFGQAGDGSDRVDTGNPRDRSLSAEAQKHQEAALAGMRERKKLKTFWLREIEENGASFSEAACVVERHGEWLNAENRCDTD